jgi:probable rRNA maturation factor
VNLQAVPTVFGADEQRDVPVDVARWVRLAQLVLDEERVIERLGADTEMSLLFVDATTISELNERFLGGTGPTDVLAFPIDDELPEAGRSPDAGSNGPDRPPVESSEVPLLLGDVLVCPVVAARNAAEHDRTLRDELALLVVHGILHVLGMDHAEDEEATVMQARERELLALLHEPA